MAAPSWDDSAAATCRFCFEGGGDLVAPCKCDGSQKYIHRDCLRKWQAHQMLAAASSRSSRNRAAAVQCSVCHAQLSTPPPSASELLEVVRPNSGANLAAALEPGVLMVSTTKSVPEVGAGGVLGLFLLHRLSYWVRSVYLLHVCVAHAATDGSDALLGVNLAREVRVGDDGQVLAVSASEVLPLAHVAELLTKDKVIANKVRAARAAGVRVRHFIGGPVSKDSYLPIHTEERAGGAAISLGDSSRRWFAGGDAWSVLQAAVERAKAGAGGRPPTVLLFLGHAKWSRTQLQNEVLRGDWGVNASQAHESLLDHPVAYESLVPEAAGTHYLAPPEA